MEGPCQAAAQRQREHRRRYEHRHVQLRLRLKPGERAALARQADALDIPAHTIALTAVRRACGLPALLGPELECARDSVRQLGAIGRNLNQITRKINAGDCSPEIDPGFLAELAERVETLGNAIGKMVDRSRKRWAPARRG